MRRCQKFFLLGKIIIESFKNLLYGKSLLECYMFRSAREFGDAVREKRKSLGWTQIELAARSGTGERFIVELESGKPSCQLEKALIVARTVGLEIGDLKTARAASSSSDDGLGFLPTFGDGR